jgi:hypothetical protein
MPTFDVAPMREAIYMPFVLHRTPDAFLPFVLTVVVSVEATKAFAFLLAHSCAQGFTCQMQS